MGSPNQEQGMKLKGNKGRVNKRKVVHSYVRVMTDWEVEQLMQLLDVCLQINIVTRTQT